MTRRALATPDDVRDFQYDVLTVSPYLHKASSRVYGYLRGRASAVDLFDESTDIPKEVAEVVCAIAHRMVATSPLVAKGMQSESIDNGSVSYGAQAYSGLADMTSAEKAALDRLYPRRPYSIVVDPQ